MEGVALPDTPLLAYLGESWDQAAEMGAGTGEGWDTNGASRPHARGDTVLPLPLKLLVLLAPARAGRHYGPRSHSLINHGACRLARRSSAASRSAVSARWRSRPKASAC